MAYSVEQFFVLSYCLLCCWPGLNAKSNLRVVEQWAELDFAFPSKSARQSALDRGFYAPGKSVPIDVDVQYRPDSEDSRIFVTVPRSGEGRPMTLTTVDDKGRLHAYPNYEWNDNQGHNCDGLTSVYRVAIDQCNRLWAMDTGKVGDNQYCPPQLLAFDLDTDELIYRHRVNQSAYINSTTTFITPVVDVRSTKPGDCSDTYVYVADCDGYGLLVVDVLHNLSWRVNHRLFYPFPSRGTITVDGVSFDLMDGIFGMALSPYQYDEDRTLYFHALAATTENVVPTSYLRNASFIENPTADPKAINVLPGERTSQSGAEAMDKNGILYFGLMDPPSIWCWNTATKFSPRNFHRIAQDQETLQFAGGLKIVNNLYGEQELWVLTSSFQRVITGSITSDRVNFRIHTEKIPIILSKSPCLYDSVE